MISMNHTFPLYILPIPTTNTVHLNLYFTTLTAIKGDLCESHISLLCNAHPSCIHNPS